MYEASFALEVRPFVAVPSVRRYFPAASMEAARTALTRCVERGEGPGMLAGPAGIGKTLLLEVLAEQFKDRLEPIRLTGGQVTTRRALLQVMLFELGLPYRGKEEAELRLTLIEHLSDNSRKTNGVLLLVDEAHNLPVRLLEEIRMVTNIIRGGEPRVHLILAGSMALEEKLTHPKLDSLSQRMAARCYLDSFNRAETCGYIAHAIASAGGDWEQVFSRASCETIYRATAGIPRLINQMADHALLLAFAEGLSRVDPDLVERAWSDLQQLPTPWAGADSCVAKPEAASSVVEFGQLPDEPAATPHVADASGPMSEPDEALETISHAEATLSNVEQHLTHIATLLQPHARPASTSTDELPDEKFDEEEILTQRYGDVVIIRPALEMDAVGESQRATSQAEEPAVALLPAALPSSTEEVVVDRYARLDAHRPATAESAVGRAVMAATTKIFAHADRQEAPVRVTSEDYSEEAAPDHSLTQDTIAETEFSDRTADTAGGTQVEADEFIADLLPVDLPVNGSGFEFPSDFLSELTTFGGSDHDELASAEWAFGEGSFSTAIEVQEEETAPLAVHGPELNLADVPELVVLEDPPASPKPEPASPAAEVRRQEYRQLFARLRRGS